MKRELAKAEHELLNAAIQLGKIAECPWHYKTGLAQLIDASGKQLHEMTIGELLTLDRQHADRIDEARERLANSQFHFAETTNQEAQS